MLGKVLGVALLVKTNREHIVLPRVATDLRGLLKMYAISWNINSISLSFRVKISAPEPAKSTSGYLSILLSSLSWTPRLHCPLACHRGNRRSEYPSALSFDFWNPVFIIELEQIVSVLANNLMRPRNFVSHWPLFPLPVSFQTWFSWRFGARNIPPRPQNGFLIFLITVILWK